MLELSKSVCPCSSKGRHEFWTPQKTAKVPALAANVAMGELALMM